MSIIKDRIELAHGAGGYESAELIEKVFSPYLKGAALGQAEDAGVVGHISSQIAVSTDSFVVRPIVFNGGDIGKIAVCGSVNDVAMAGSIPKYLTCGFVLEVGLDFGTLEEIVKSLAKTAEEAGVEIVACDTKVVGAATAGEEPGLIINTTAVGVYPDGTDNEDGSCGSSGSTLPRPAGFGVKAGDVIIVSGDLGRHHAAILSARMGVENGIESDCALLTPLVAALREGGIAVHSMRDITRGGLGTVLNELAVSSQVSIEIEKALIPVDAEVKAFAGVMGLDPLYMGNEGRMVLAVAAEDEAKTLEVLRGFDIGKNAVAIGLASDIGANSLRRDGGAVVVMRTPIGGLSRVSPLYGEGLPRIC